MVLQKKLDENQACVPAGQCASLQSQSGAMANHNQAAVNHGVRIGKTFLIRLKPDGTLDETFIDEVSKANRVNAQWFVYDSAEQDDAHLIGQCQPRSGWLLCIWPNARRRPVSRSLLQLTDMGNTAACLCPALIDC